MKPLNMTEAIAAIVTAICLVMAIWVAFMGPTSPIPMQFGLDGSVNRFGSRYELAGALAFMGLLNFIMMRMMKSQAAQMSDPVRQEGLMRGRMMSSVIIGGLALFITWSSLGSDGVRGVGNMAISMVVISLIFLCIGAVLGRVSPNPWMGVRTPWSYKSRLAWDRSNRLAGRLFFWLGVAGLISAAFVPQPLGMMVLIIGVLVASGLSIWESWRVWKSDPEAQAF